MGLGERVTATQAVKAGRTGLLYECQEYPIARFGATC